MPVVITPEERLLSMNTTLRPTGALLASAALLASLTVATVAGTALARPDPLTVSNATATLGSVEGVFCEVTVSASFVGGSGRWATFDVETRIDGSDVTSRGELDPQRVERSDGEVSFLTRPSRQVSPDEWSYRVRAVKVKGSLVESMAVSDWTSAIVCTALPA